MDISIGKITYETIQILEGDHHIVVTGKMKADNGDLAAGLVLCKNADGLLVGIVPQTEALAGTIDGANKVFTLASSDRPILPKSLVITHGVQEILDDGHGNLYGDGTGTVFYETGAIEATFTAAPAESSPAPEAAFEDVPHSVLLEQTDTTKEDAAAVVVHGKVKKSALVDAAGDPVSGDLVEALRALTIYA